MTDEVDPLAILANLLYCLALADTIGDIGGDIVHAWDLAGLGEFPEAEGGEPFGDGTGCTYYCGDIMTHEITRLHGVCGLHRQIEYEVKIQWTDDWAHPHELEVSVKADSPMDAARVAYHKACDEHSASTIGYADAHVEGELFKLEPATCVRVRKVET